MSKKKNPSPEELSDRYVPMSTPMQFTKRVNVSKTRTYRGIADGEIHAVKFGNKFRIPEEEVQRVKRDGLRTIKVKAKK